MSDWKDDGTLYGLRDALGGVQRQPQACPRCGSITRVAHELCVHCLLQSALGPEDEKPESLDALLSEIDVRDLDWRLGNYQVLEEIGRGGMGVIYRARQRHSRRIVALKRVLGYHADSRETLARFRREAEAAASLDHPNVLPIYEVGESEGLPFFSMKFAAGGSLRNAGAVLRGEPRRCVWLMHKVAKAVHFAHTRGILHRDLKPGNILLDGHGEPFVSDFGLAKWLEATSELTQSLTIFGTPGYIAPEQAAGPAADLKAAADIYSLGAILFDLLTGRPPFLGEHALAVVRQASEEPAPKLRTVVPSLDRDVETICARCLEREPSARYQSAGDLAEDLERWLDGRSIRARPVLPPVTLWRWSRRNRALATAAAACFCLGAIAIYLGLCRAEAEREAREAKQNATAKPAAHIVPRKSVAVLPFENLDHREGPDVLVNGIQEDVVKDLARIADLKVISSDSVRSYQPELPRDVQAIGQALDVRYLVEGGVRRDAKHIRVDAQLIDASTGARRWAEHYERNLTDFFDIKSELAQAIAHQLRARITKSEQTEIARRPTADLKAYDLYLKARALAEEAIFSNQIGENFLGAVQLLKQAISRDPNFFDAYVELAADEDCLYFFGYDHSPACLAVADQAIKTLLRLRPDAGESHFALARHYYGGFLDYDNALRELGIAQETLPNESRVMALQAYIDRRRGRWKEASNELIRASDLNPRDFYIQQQTALTFQYQRRFGEMARVLERALAIMPQHSATRIVQSTIPFQKIGDTRPLHDTLEAVITSDPRAGPQLAPYWYWLGLWERDVTVMARAIAVMPPEGLAVDTVRFPRSWCEAMAAKMRGHVSQAHAKLLQARAEVADTIRQQPNFPVMFSVLGLIDATLGRKEMATREGRQAVDALPLSRDSINGAHAITYLVAIYAWTGEKDLALEQLRTSASIPSDVTYGYLLLDPIWDPLRGDPRFEKILASLAPKR